MRTLFLAVTGLLLAHIALLQIHPAGAAAPPAAGGLDIGVVFDVGGRGDKSFNDGAYRQKLADTISRNILRAVYAAGF